jgi:hypothetical protein
MPAVLLPDALWKLVEPLLPSPRCSAKGGRPRLSNRALLGRYPVRTAQRHSLGDVAAGIGVRLRDDLLEAPTGLATSGHLGPDPFCAAGLARA